MKVYLEEIKGLTTGRSVTLPKGTTKIGRKDCDINISNQRVSQNHAEIHFSGTRVFVLDRNSTNGTFVNGRKIERIALRDGDVISIGGTSEDTAAEFKVHIIRMFSRRRVVVIVKQAGKAPKFLLGLGFVLILSFVLWLFIPQSDNSGKFPFESRNVKDVNKPWIDAPPLLTAPLNGGYSFVIALGDSIILPDGIKWDTSVNYDDSKDSDPFDTVMFVTVINPMDDNSVVNENDKVVATITAQKFKKDFSSDIGPYVEDNFKWHMVEFIKDNKITDQKFNYAFTDLCTWQWIVWEKETKFNLYASCITKRGRILLQASSFDSYTIKRFFQYVAGSYKEGKE